MTGKSKHAEREKKAQDASPQRTSGRPRSEASRGAVLGAAYAILAEMSLKDFSVDAVALRAGVARTTIYRWWPTKGVLAIECLLEAFRPQLAFRATGDAASDFRALLRSLTRALAGPAGRIAASVLVQAQGDAETMRLFRDQFSEPLRRESSKVLHAGIQAGQFRADLNVPRLLDCAVGAVYLRLLTAQSLDAKWTQDLGDTLLGSDTGERRAPHAVRS